MGLIGSYVGRLVLSGDVTSTRAAALSLPTDSSGAVTRSFYREISQSSWD